eukprot:4660857-Pyramimonas_sp.AAC.1
MQRVARALPPLQGNLYMQVLSNSVPTSQAVIKLGCRVEDERPLCGQPGDSSWRRMWIRPHEFPVAARTEHCSRDVIGQILEAGQD